MKKYYKVLSVVEDKLYSYNCSKNFTDLSNEKYVGTSLEYKVGEWISPKINGSDLFIIDNIENARNLAGHNYIIFECEAKNVKKIGIVASTFGFLPNAFKTMLDLKLKKKKYSHLSYYNSCYKGTLFCSSLKLIRQVQ